MTWFGWIATALLMFGIVTHPAQIGKPRKPISGRHASITLAISLLLLAGYLFVGTGHL